MSDPRLRVLPAALAERARRFAAGGVAAVQPRAAATVVLLREAGGRLEVYLLRRARSMVFAGGMYAFPGGAVDRRDADQQVDWVGPTPGQWAQRLGASLAEARMLVCAAVRETFEESGVLLAGPSADAVVVDPSDPAWEQDRAGLVARDRSFADLLARRGLALRTDLLELWAHWITPEFEERRYDTRIFVAALPGGQLARDVSGEADRVCWLAPGEAVARLQRREINMLPPTAVTLAELAAYDSVAEVLAAAPARTIRTITPAALVPADPDREVRLVLPGEPGYPE